jgi:mannonate dehydratase
MKFKYTWRWFGPDDPIKLKSLKHFGLSGIVTALHHIPNGEVWPVDEIKQRKGDIEKAGFSWEVVESLPVSESVKQRKGQYKRHLENYKQSLVNLGRNNLKTICYNFMPVLDWTRTNLNYTFPDGSSGLSYEHKALAAFDIFILKRKGAHEDYPEDTLLLAEKHFGALGRHKIKELSQTILQGLPGSEESYTLDKFHKALEEYRDIDSAALLENLVYFLQEVIPVAEENGMNMAIHPDDPPWGLFGLPRVVSRLEDIKTIIEAVPAMSNGITLCTGSYGAGYFNDVAEIAEEMAPRIHFAHLRNVSRDEQLNFREEYLLEGDVDIRRITGIVAKEQERRKLAGMENWQIPIRPDHGNSLNARDRQKYKPGYALDGREKGLREIQGIIGGDE